MLKKANKDIPMRTYSQITEISHQFGATHSRLHFELRLVFHLDFSVLFQQNRFYIFLYFYRLSYSCINQ